MCHGGSGWLEYDRATRQQCAIDPAKPWNVLHPGLHSSFILSWSSVAAVKHCTACQGVDHTTSQFGLGLSHLDKAVQFLFGRGSPLQRYPPTSQAGDAIATSAGSTSSSLSH